MDLIDCSYFNSKVKSTKKRVIDEDNNVPQPPRKMLFQGLPNLRDYVKDSESDDASVKSGTHLIVEIFIFFIA